MSLRRCGCSASTFVGITRRAGRDSESILRGALQVYVSFGVACGTLPAVVGLSIGMGDSTFERIHGEGTRADHVRQSIEDQADLALHLEVMHGAAHVVTCAGYRGGVVGNGAGVVALQSLCSRCVIHTVSENNRRLALHGIGCGNYPLAGS